MYLTKNLNPNYIFKHLLHHLLVHNKLAPINQFKACIYALTLTVGQKFRCSLVGSTASRSFMKLQSRRQPGLRCHLKACWDGDRKGKLFTSKLTNTVIGKPPSLPAGLSMELPYNILQVSNSRENPRLAATNSTFHNDYLPL